MGCVLETPLNPIPPPQGPAKNPLEQEGDVVAIITEDPHIHYFQKKIEEVLLPIRKRKKVNKNAV